MLAHRLVRRLRHQLRHDRGASTIELAIFTPFMLLVILVTVQFALIYNARHIALAAARDANRVSRSQTGTHEQAVAQGDKMITQLGPSLFDGRPTVTATTQGNDESVTVTGNVLSVVPFGLAGSVTKVDETATGPKEQFCPAGQACG